MNPPLIQPTPTIDVVDRRIASLGPVWETVLFLLPLAIILGTPGFVQWLGGELTSPDTVIRELVGGRPVLDGRAYTNPASYVKLRVVAQQRPKVLVLGNSRVLEFRRELFEREVSFYNAGGVVGRLQHFRAFLENLPPNSLPEVLLLAAEGGYFNAEFDKLDADGMNVSWLQKQISQYPTATGIYLGNWSTTWSDMRQGKVKWNRLLSFEGLHHRVGLNALFNDTGFRVDGSYQYALVDLDITDPRHQDFQFARTLKFIEGGKGRFVWGDAPSAPALQEMEALLDFCTSHHIHVIAFMPPHAHAVWLAIQHLGDRYGYLPKLAAELKVRLENRGFEFYDFSDFATIGVPDTEMLDGFHGNERAYVQLFVAMLDRGSRLNAYSSRAELSAALAAAKTPSAVFPPQL